MKPFLGTDLTQNKKNETPNGEEFRVATAPTALTDKLEAEEREGAELYKAAQFPLPVRIVQILCGIVGGLSLCGIMTAMCGEDAVSLSVAWQNAAWLFWLTGGCLVVWLLLTVLGYRRMKDMSESREVDRLTSRMDATVDETFATLDVPSDAASVEVISFAYKVKNGAIKACERLWDMTPYYNLGYKLYTDAEHLYLANLEAVYRFPLASLQKIRTVKKHIQLAAWHKDEKPDVEEYKEYKLTQDQYDLVHTKWYHILELEQDGEVWGIYFPCYELPAFEAATGLRAEGR